MERLLLLFMIAFAIGLAALGLGGWMVHTGLSAGDVYKVILGAISLVVGLWFSIPLVVAVLFGP